MVIFVFMNIIKTFFIINYGTTKKNRKSHISVIPFKIFLKVQTNLIVMLYKFLSFSMLSYRL